jgi:hypothetical protein
MDRGGGWQDECGAAGEFFDGQSSFAFGKGASKTALLGGGEVKRLFAE